MATEPKLSYEFPVHAYWDDNHFHAETPNSFLVASYNLPWGFFYISDIHVEPALRRNNIGKQLLSVALEAAQEKDASMIMSAIVSRECLDAMRSVFGSNALQVLEEGTYQDPTNPTPNLDARAGLTFHLH
jgi:GNAT superfamily N-acetyltransferase